MEPAPVRDLAYLSIDDVIRIHERIIEETGGHSGILNFGNLAFTLDFVRSQVYTLVIGDMFLLAAMIAKGIIDGHPFVDGNKRTGMEAADVFLNTNGFMLSFDPDESIEFTLSIAQGDQDLGSISDWFRHHSRVI